MTGGFALLCLYLSYILVDGLPLPATTKMTTTVNESGPAGTKIGSPQTFFAEISGS